MKKKAKRKYTRRAQPTQQPFTCQIHGQGIDIDVRLDGTGNLDKLTAAIAEAFVRKPDTSPLPPFDAMVAACFAEDLSDAELVVTEDAIVRERQRRQAASTNESADPVITDSASNGVHNTVETD